MLTLNNVNSYYGRSQVLHGLSLEAPAGGILGVLGRNGVGKTTLLRTILGLTDRSEGIIQLDGEEISGLRTYRRARRGIAYVPQGRHIIPDFTIEDNILMGGFGDETGKAGIPEIVPELFPYLMENLHRQGGLLSGGQQQQLAIARALAGNPRVLLMDEPTEGIQPNIVEQIQSAVMRLNTELGITIVLVEQDVGFVRRAAEAFVMIEHGHTVEAGGIADLTEAVVHRHMAIG